MQRVLIRSPQWMQGVGLALLLLSPQLVWAQEETLVGHMAQAQALEAAGEYREAGLQRGVVTVDGHRRSYQVFVPRTYDDAVPMPLVMVLHGHAGSARRIMRISRMNATAEQAGFLVVYPQGTGWLNLPPRSWNADTCCGYAFATQVDDVRFLGAVLDALQATFAVDPNRIYATGASNGAMMAYRLGCDVADRFAAIASVAGAMDLSSCRPVHPVSVVIFHGTQDDYVPYDGGVGRRHRTPRRDAPVEDAVTFWARHNGCSATPVRQVHASIETARYTHCRHGTEVLAYTIHGGGHAWPGGARGWRFGDVPSMDLSATERMWEFFAAHPQHE